ncbi:hypothetical protein [Tsukamurella tyrosinosolvens]|uniref:hypothetical protein n=1 Tax=Tsukamurella tyrosinosolvens TaxID=57704 RepID=UPI000A93F740|nr:hypothetical protein [Tsukamurella tyrosinosolvens]
MFRRPIEAVLIAAATALAVTGCSQGRNTESTSFPSYTPMSLQEVPTFAPTTAPLPTTATVPTTTTAALPAGPWVTPPEADDSAPEEAKSYGRPGPGVSVTDGKGQCTLGYAIESSRGEIGFLTAGHCVSDVTTPLTTTDNDGTRHTLTPYSASVNGGGIDIALTYLPTNSAPYFSSITQRIRVKGWLTAAQVRALPNGTPICVSGGHAFIRCGGKKSSSATMIAWDGSAFPGDSGAPVFIVNPVGNAYAVGLLRGGDGSGDDVRGNNATLIAPALSRWGLQLLG